METISLFPQSSYEKQEKMDYNDNKQSLFLFMLNWLLNRLFMIINNIKNINNTASTDELVKTDSLRSISTCPDTKKFEDKYLDKFNKLTNDYFFTDHEKQLELDKYNELLKNIDRESNDKLKQDLENYAQELSDIDDFERGIERKAELTTKIDTLQSELSELDLKEKQDVKTESNKYVINTILDRLLNCFIIENTPLGNVIMFYNNKRDTFEYYCDHSIPYRYLEVVCRKYVITYKCKPLYVDMEHEINESKRKLKEKKEKRENDEKEKLVELKKKNNIEPKKSVFTKFKSYNSDAGTGRVNTGAPPKNSIPTNKIDNTQNDNVVLKENANRYSYQGKVNKFTILKKIDKKLVNKKFAMSFADFKKQQLLTKI